MNAGLQSFDGFMTSKAWLPCERDGVANDTSASVTSCIRTSQKRWEPG